MILVFKTSIDNETEVNHVAPVLNRILGNGAWNFDLEDCDRILRVVTEVDQVEEIATAISASGFFCEELGD
ncbi:hypothetical protein IFO69_17805 [Echinicola sp. CAU 1574]|uniref:Uncharacterized protein n=1 Tax=Echinicola arenosa TaxID=2774144 RepID=A0ABR9AP97_9BACT|nr:hypothetical protein [Echinicola arenosa]MBD8490613.1 hypothetical protein [Echinicola arenosa]